MEFLIDKKFWNKVMKKINVPSVVLEMKEELKHEKSGTFKNLIGNKSGTFNLLDMLYPEGV